MACCGKGKTPQPEPKQREDTMTKLDKALAVAEGVEIEINQAMSLAELDKKKTHKPTIQRGPAHPGHKPHGVVKPRQQRGMAHGQRVAKHEASYSHAHAPDFEWEHGVKKHDLGGKLHDDCATILQRASAELDKARTYLDEGDKPPKGTEPQEGPRGGRYYESRKEIHERARTTQRLQSQRDKIHGDIERRREKRETKVKKQHPDEYPEEWGLHEPDNPHYRPIQQEKHPVNKALDAAREVMGDVEKLIKAGCPAGQHRHDPYDYCHPSDRKHHGYTDEKPSGPMDAAHGVLDAAIAEAQGIGAPKLAEILQEVKGKLDIEGRPEQAAQQLSAVADSYTEAAAQRLKSPNIGIRVQALGLKKVADTLRRAAKKLAAPQATVEPTNQLAASFDKLMERAAAHDAKGLVAVLRQAQGKVADDPEGVRRSMASLAGVYDRKSQQRKRTPDQKLRYRALATLARMAANAIMVDQAVEATEGRRAKNTEEGQQARERREERTPGMGTEWQHRPGGGRSDY